MLAPQSSQTVALSAVNRGETLTVNNTTMAPMSQ